jgi:beta-1,4-mannosyltransferase
MEPSLNNATILFLPYGEGNPYPEELAGHLTSLGLTVLMPRCNTVFLFDIFNRWKPDVLHLHWLNVFIHTGKTMKAVAKLVIFLGQLALLRMTGLTIVWTVHNLKDHESLHPRLDFICAWFVAHFSGAVITHCDWAKKEVAHQLRIRRTDKIFSIPHANYRESYPNRISGREARNKLGIQEGKVVFLFLGAIRPYKGLPRLIRSFREQNSEDARLLIAGKPMDPALQKALQNECGDDLRITCRFGFVPDPEIQTYMNACDAVVFPFEDIFTSGSILLAMSFGRACIAPRIGCVQEVLDRSGAFLYEPGDECGLMDAMKYAVAKKPELEEMERRNLEKVKGWTWENAARRTLEAYRYAMGR